MVTISVHLTVSIVSLYNTIPSTLSTTAFILGFLFALSEAVATFIWRRGLGSRHLDVEIQ
jgi:hypothetical protein